MYQQPRTSTRAVNVKIIPFTYVCVNNILIKLIELAHIAQVTYMRAYIMRGKIMSEKKKKTDFFRLIFQFFLVFLIGIFASAVFLKIHFVFFDDDQ